MCQAVFICEFNRNSGKLVGLSHTATCDIGQHSSRLVINDSITNLHFLIDSGSDISVLPSSLKDRLNNNNSNSVFNLVAANGTTIKVYGKKQLKVSLGLRRVFTWLFTIADVSQPIIGSDFLSHYNLLVNLKGHSLVDGMTFLRSQGKVVIDPTPTVTTMNADNNKFHQLIQSYADVMEDPPVSKVTSSSHRNKRPASICSCKKITTS